MVETYTCTQNAVDTREDYQRIIIQLPVGTAPHASSIFFFFIFFCDKQIKNSNSKLYNKRNYAVFTDHYSPAHRSLRNSMPSIRARSPSGTSPNSISLSGKKCCLVRLLGYMVKKKNTSLSLGKRSFP